MNGQQMVTDAKKKRTCMAFIVSARKLFCTNLPKYVKKITKNISDKKYTIFYFMVTKL